MGKVNWRTMRGARLPPRRRAHSLVSLALARLAHRRALSAARRAAQRAPGGHAGRDGGGGLQETKVGDSAAARLPFPEGFVHRFRFTVESSRALSTRCPSP